MSDALPLADVLVAIATALIGGYGLLLLVTRLASTRPGLAIGAPVAAAFVVRILAVVAVSVSFAGIVAGQRGGDEVHFLADARATAATPFGADAWIDALTGHLHVFVLAVQAAVLGSPEFALRVAQAAIAVAGLVLLASAVWELAGGRAARIAMWALAFEPAGIFFATALHKEANMTLAAGLVALGGAMLWKRGRLSALAPMALGCSIAVATRPYAGWFLIAAAAAIALHAGLRQRREEGARALALIAIVVMAGALAAPIVFGATGSANLEQLQRSQEANAANREANLSLERVDFSTPGAIAANLPRRIVDVLTRPFPWQLQNLNQQIGLIGTAVAYLVLVLLASELIRSRGSIMSRAGPLIYTGAFLLVAYSLAAGNAGTAFRYRSHLVTIAICLIVTLWQLRLQRAGAGEHAPRGREHGRLESPAPVP